MRRKHEGLTLVELMVTLAAAIILVAVGMPFFGGVVANNRATAEANAMLSTMKLARSEAIKRGVDISIVATGSDWANGWTVFEDADADNAVDAGEGIRVWPAMNGATVSGVAGNAVLVFERDGSSNAAHDFDLAWANTSGPGNRCLTISLAGQIRMKKQEPAVAWECP
jgi:type IV fimbrial biogenesis protein FimT